MNRKLPVGTAAYHFIFDVCIYTRGWQMLLGWFLNNGASYFLQQEPLGARTLQLTRFHTQVPPTIPGLTRGSAGGVELFPTLRNVPDDSSVCVCKRPQPASILTMFGSLLNQPKHFHLTEISQFSSFKDTHTHTPE